MMRLSHYLRKTGSVLKEMGRELKTAMWNYQDAKRGFIMALISITIYYILTGPTSIFGYYDEAFAHSFVQPYGLLWYLLNPFFQDWTIYRYVTVISYSAIIAPQIYLVKKGKISPWVVLLNILSAVMFRTNQTSQNMTVIAFAPLATINPLFSILLVIQKMALGFSWNLSDGNWKTWVSQVNGDPWEMPYLFLIAWFFLPIVVWMKKNHKFTKRNVVIIVVILIVLAVLLFLRQSEHCVRVTPPGAIADGNHDVWVC